MSNGFVDLTRTNVNGFKDFVTELGDVMNTIENFIEDTKLEKTELVWNFLSMVEFSGATVDGITPRNYMSDFMVNMLKAFEDFDKLPLGDMYPNGGLITQQFKALVQKCAAKGVKLLIGEDPRNNNIGVDKTKLHQDNVFINFSENMVKNLMKNPIYIIQQEGNNIPEIKAIPLAELVAGQENINYDDPTLIDKCAAYLLFHELFHVNTFVEFSQWKSSQYDEDVDYVSNHDITGFSQEHINSLLSGPAGGDDFRNVVGVTKFGEERVPGEYELLQALYPDKKIMRLYEGKLLNFSDSKVLEAAVKVSRFVNDSNDSSRQIGYLQQHLNLNRKIKNFLNDKETQFSKMELNGNIQAKFKDAYDMLANVNTQLESYIKMNGTETKVDTSVWEAQANLYIENINKILEEAEKGKFKGAYIPS